MVIGIPKEIGGRVNEKIASHCFWHADRLRKSIVCPAFGDIMLYSARSPQKDSANEDGALVMYGDDMVVLAIADGVGGQALGDEAAKITLDIIANEVVSGTQSGQVTREAILSGFDCANQAVLELGGGAATTLVVAEIQGRTLRTYHVGDSGILAFSSRGSVRLQTIAHSPVGYALESGLMDEREAMDHEDRHLVSNVIGDPSMHVGVSGEIGLALQDTVVLASDGLFDNLFTEEVVGTLRRGRLPRALEATVVECERRMQNQTPDLPSKPDDLTILVFRYRNRNREATAVG
jgi:serine/threonine protein phosphatase PrpC